MSFRRATLLSACLAGACTDVCSFEDQVGTHLAEHEDAIDCRFAWRFAGTGGPDIVGAATVRDGILDAIARSSPFVGGYMLYGIDAGQRAAFFGRTTRDGLALSYVYERPAALRPVTIYRSACAAIVERVPTPNDIGLHCEDVTLEPVCGAKR